jgi:hypothetical protein
MKILAKEHVKNEYCLIVQGTKFNLSKEKLGAKEKG